MKINDCISDRCHRAYFFVATGVCRVVGHDVWEIPLRDDGTLVCMRCASVDFRATGEWTH